MRILYVVPRMYTLEELELILLGKSEDYPSKATEFWQYIEEKITPLKERINHVYRDMVTEGGEEGLKIIKEIDESCYQIIKTLVDAGAILEPTEDKDLVAEAESWVRLMRTEGLRDTTLGFFKETLEERNKHISKVISENLKPDECGVLFIEPTRLIQFDPDIKIYKVCPFLPTDYVNSIISRKLSKPK